MENKEGEGNELPVLPVYNSNIKVYQDPKLDIMHPLPNSTHHTVSREEVTH